MKGGKIASHKLFLRFLLGYLALLLIIFSLSVPIYRLCVQAITEVTYNNSQFLLSNQVRTLDDELGYLRNVAAVLRRSPDFVRLASLSNGQIEAPQYAVLRSASDQMLSFIHQSDIIDHMFFLFRNNSIYVDKLVADVRVSRTYPLFASLRGLALDDFLTQLNYGKMPYFMRNPISDAAEFSAGNARRANELLIYIIPVAADGMVTRADAAMVCYLDKQKLERQFYGAGASYTGVSLFDNKGKALCSFGNTQGKNGLTHIPFIQGENLSAKALIDYRVLLAGSAISLRLPGLLLSMSFVLAIGIALILAWRNYRPYQRIQRIVAAIAPNDQGMSSDVSGIINDLSAVGTHIQRLNSSLDDLTRFCLFERLIHKQKTDDQDEDQLCHSLHFLLSGYAVVVLRITPFMEREKRDAYFSGLSAKWPALLYVHNRDNEYSVMIISTAQQNWRETCQAALEEQQSLMLRHHKRQLCASVSGVGMGFDQFGHLYERARNLLRLKPGTQGKCIHFLHEPEKQDYCVRIGEIQRILINIMAGDEQNIQAIINRIFDQMGHMNTLDESLLTCNFSAIRNALLFAARELGVESLDAEDLRYTQDKTLDELREVLTHSAHILCQAAMKLKENPDRHIDLFRQDVDEHYADWDLSAASIAQRMKLSEKYLYSLVKKSLGISLGDYIEEYRINKACDMLRRESISIAAISEACGFGTYNTFYKALKRHTGLSPSHYRRSQAQ